MIIAIEPLLDDFQIKDGCDTEIIKIQNASNMQVACSKILNLNFREDVFKQAERWCFVKKKDAWVSKSLKDRDLLKKR